MTSKAEELKNQIAAKAQNTGLEQKPLQPSQQVAAYLKDMMPAMQAILPKHVTAERMSRIALNVIRTNPKLLNCNINSLMGGVMEAAKLGLEPGMMGQCYLIPFEKKQNQGGKWVVVDTEAQFIIGYKGLIDLVRRSGQVSMIEARTVYENDVFDFDYGLDSKLVHKPTLTDRGAAIAYYGVAKLKDGGHSFLVMSKQEMEEYKEKHAKAKGYGGKVVGPWADEFDAMARKTTLRQLIKYLPISVEQLGNYEQSDGAEGSKMHNEVLQANAMESGQYVPMLEITANGENMEGNPND